jgi:biopolymer transport protein ExbB
MAETNPTAKTTVRSTTSVQAKKSSNAISWIAPLVCILGGYVIWRFVMGADANFTNPDPKGGFWPDHKGPTSAFSKMYEGG